MKTRSHLCWKHILSTFAQCWSMWVTNITCTLNQSAWTWTSMPKVKTCRLCKLYDTWLWVRDRLQCWLLAQMEWVHLIEESYWLTTNAEEDKTTGGATSILHHHDLRSKRSENNNQIIEKFERQLSGDNAWSTVEDVKTLSSTCRNKYVC